MLNNRNLLISVFALALLALFPQVSLARERLPEDPEGALLPSPGLRDNKRLPVLG